MFSTRAGRKIGFNSVGGGGSSFPALETPTEGPLQTP